MPCPDPDILDNVPKIEAMLENRSGVYGHLLESLAKVGALVMCAVTARCGGVLSGTVLVVRAVCCVLCAV